MPSITAAIHYHVKVKNRHIKKIPTDVQTDWNKTLRVTPEEIIINRQLSPESASKWSNSLKVRYRKVKSLCLARHQATKTYLLLN